MYKSPIVQCTQFRHPDFCNFFQYFTAKKIIVEILSAVYYIVIVKVNFYDKNRFCK